MCVLSEGWQEAGEKNLRFSIDRDKLPAGIYYLKLRHGSETQTRVVAIGR